MLLAAPIIASPAAGTVKAYAVDQMNTVTQEQQISAFQYTYSQQHSFAEINQYYTENPYDTEMPDKYDVIPDIANEEMNAKIAAGELNLWGNKELQ